MSTMQYMKLNSPKKGLNTKINHCRVFILQFAELQFFELYYNFFTSCYDVQKFEELKMNTDSLCLVLAERELEDCIRPEMKAEWKGLRLKDCSGSFTADAVANFFLRWCCDEQKKHYKRVWTPQRGIRLYRDVMFMWWNFLLLWYYRKQC